MKRIVLAIGLVCACSMAVGYEVTVRRVHDGDTIMVTDTALPVGLRNMSVRLQGIDTPELQGACEAETRAAVMAREILKQRVVPGSRITLNKFKWDKYGGRIDAIVTVAGEDLSEVLIASGNAVRYTGRGAKRDWCLVPA